MQLAGLSYMSAPQATGHPLGLPGAPDKTPSVTKVQPILDARRPETQLGTDTPPSAFWKLAQGRPDPATHNPPPSIMQIKISQMLQDQVMAPKSEEPVKEDTAETDSLNAAEQQATVPSPKTEEQPVAALVALEDAERAGEDAVALALGEEPTDEEAPKVEIIGPGSAKRGSGETSPATTFTVTGIGAPQPGTQSSALAQGDATSATTRTRAAATPERAPMTMPVRAEPAAQSQSAPAAYEEAATISRRDMLSTLT